MDKNFGKQTWQRKMDNAKEISSLFRRNKVKANCEESWTCYSLDIYYIHCRTTPHKAINQHAKATLESLVAQEKSELCEK